MSWVGYLILTLTALLAGQLLWVRWASLRIRGRSVAGLAGRFPVLGSGRGRAVIYCYRADCGPCRQMAPLMDRLGAQYPNLIRLDLEAEPEVARQLGIRATPTTLLVEDGNVTQVLLGSAAARAAAQFLGAG